MNVVASISIEDIEDNSRTVWDLHERERAFLSDLDADIEASIQTCLQHWGLKANVTVSFAPTMGNTGVDS